VCRGFALCSVARAAAQNLHQLTYCCFGVYQYNFTRE
jgi:hypothetical protein